MSAKSLILFIASFVLLSFVEAQNRKVDSAAVVKTFQKLWKINHDIRHLPDTSAKKITALAEIARYIIYRGDNKQKAWKTFTDPAVPEDQKIVEEMCARFKKTTFTDCNQRFVKYFTEKESEGTWHILIVEYERKAGAKRVSYAFLKIGNRFGLGDID